MMVYKLQGDHENALLQLKKGLEIKLRICGCEHPEMASAYNEIALYALAIWNEGTLVPR